MKFGLACSRRSVLVAAFACPAGALALNTFAGAQETSAAPPTFTEIDTSSLAEGELIVAQWRGHAIWVLHRSPAMVERLASPQLHAQLADPTSDLTDPAHTPAYARNPLRSIHEQYFVALATCPHAGCQPVPRLKPGPNPDRDDNWPGGFACPCHFATFDLAGRVFRGKPTSENIPVPRHMYLSPSRLVIGRDADGEA